MLSEELWENKHYGPLGSRDRLKAYLPHVVDYHQWQIVQEPPNVREVFQTRGHPRVAQGSGVTDWVVANAAEPYDVVAIYVGTWDASFSVHNITNFAQNLEVGLSRLLEAWPDARIVLFTCTPCGGKDYLGKRRPYTPKAACEFVQVMNRIIVDIANHHPRLELLDAYQMTTSYPGSEWSTGIWLWDDSNWHFSGIGSTAGRERIWKSGQYPLCSHAERDWTNLYERVDGKGKCGHPMAASGEMNRAFVNRLLNMVC